MQWDWKLNIIGCVRVIRYFMEYCLMYNLNRKTVRLTDNYITSRYSCVAKKTIILITSWLNETTFSSWYNLIKCVHIELTYFQGKCEEVCVCKCGKGVGGNTTIQTVIGMQKYTYHGCYRLNSVPVKTFWIMFYTQLDKRSCLLNGELFEHLQYVLVCRLFTFFSTDCNCIYQAV